MTGTTCEATTETVERTLTCDLPTNHLSPVHKDGEAWGDEALPDPNGPRYDADSAATTRPAR